METYDLSSAWKKLKEYYMSGNFWRLVGICILIIMPVGIILGFTFMFIAQGIFFILLRLTPFWEPAGKLFGKLAPPTSEKLKTWGWWKWIFVFLYSIPSLLLIIAGIWILIITGFNNQNFIYLLLLK